MNPDSISSPTTINISCAECNAIRPFSGGPPNWKCEVCGWELGTSSRGRSGGAPVAGMDSKKSSNMDLIADGLAGFLKIIFLGIGFVVAVYYVNYYFLQSDSDRLANEYSVPADKVVVDKKPHGCDYNDAPLGEKHCHFEKVVEVDRECNQPNCKPVGVYVSWRKVSE